MRRERGRRRLLAWVLSFILIAGAGGPAVYAWDLGKLFQKEEPGTDGAPSVLKMYTRCEKIDAEITEKTLSCPKGTYEMVRKLFDGDEATGNASEKPVSVTLDLGETRMLAGVRVLPDAAGDDNARSRCIGARFYASRDNKSFQEVAVLEPLDSGGCPAQWRELLASGAGEYRYLKAELPAGAAFAEIAWLEYPDWSYAQSREKGKSDLNLKLQAYDAPEELEARLVTAVYNCNGVLKGFYPAAQSFAPNTQTQVDIQLPGIVHELGDSYRVAVWEADGTPALEQPLQYRYSGAASDFYVPNVFSDHMLLQADKPLRVWGKAPAMSLVEVTLENTRGGQVVRETRVEKDSDWEVDMGSFSAGGQYTLTVRAGTEKRVFEDIVFGDVWLCVGQSNMDYYMLGGKDTEEYLDSEQGRREVNNPNIRLLNLWNKGVGGAGAAVNQLPLGSQETVWAPMDRDAANYCSAVGYYFAQGVQQEYNVPVGLLSVAVGDTEINRWIPWGDTYGSFTSTDGGLYFNRVAPFEKLQIRGILMYQGEADQYRTHLTAGEYRDAMAGLVDHYRDIWGAEIPFYWAQLTRYNRDESQVREGQRLALDRISSKKNAGLISLMDLYGEYEGGTGSCREDIHPHQKKEAAERFLRYAKRDVYGEPGIAVSGPVYQSMKTAGNKIELSFACTGNLSVMPKERYADKVTDRLIQQNGLDAAAPQEFEVAGADGVFVKAQAEIQGNRVLVWSDQVSNPVAARYAWGAYPEMPNLTDSSGLPALAFTTEKIK